ncbi:hypothetical protein CesoFtcFv8_001660 [Champsocephalus esox]|uniref:Uncharacterized protein n=2 Tax=Champsocephalus TaxID=52236 RepID=A0AAN8I1G9_CHAGU|nr:hypothetical protein CesoFtcFv8_001660 [Champsocephalus esox]KAK5936036.1 hypothetical protein CgunFtcFv8_021339 [Champsocephalus gunnari]
MLFNKFHIRSFCCSEKIEVQDAVRRPGLSKVAPQAPAPRPQQGAGYNRQHLLALLQCFPGHTALDQPVLWEGILMAGTVLGEFL